MKHLVLDIGGSAIKYAIITEKIEFLEKGKIPTPLDCIESLVNVIGELYDKYKDEVEGIAISMPGLIDSKNGYARTGGMLRYNDDKYIVKILQERCPTKITIENDAKCAALAEVWNGSLKDYDDGIVVVLGSGVGGAIVKDRKILRGKHFFAGEFSYIWTDTNSEKYEIENWWGYVNGCATLNGTVAEVKKLPKEVVDGFKVFELVNSGDEDALNILDKFTFQLAAQIYNLHCVLDTEIVAIGGGISEQDILIEYVKKNIKKIFDRTPYDLPRVEIVRCKYRNDANLIGALYNFLGLEECNDKLKGEEIRGWSK